MRAGAPPRREGTGSTRLRSRDGGERAEEVTARPAALRRALRDAHAWPALATRVEGDVVEHIVYDSEVGGRRYLLVRTEARERTRRLSPREAQIAALVAEGWPTKAIARHLGISFWTVGTYLRRVYTRFGVRSRAAMIARLLDEGLLPRHRV